MVNYFYKDNFGKNYYDIDQNDGMIRGLKDLAAESENNAEKQNPAIASVKNAKEAAEYFHAKITSNKESYASGSTAIYSVNYTIDRDKIHEGDYDYSEGCGDSGA